MPTYTFTFTPKPHEVPDDEHHYAEFSSAFEAETELAARADAAGMIPEYTDDNYEVTVVESP